MTKTSSTRNQVFISYSHADDEYLQRLRKHLGQLERRNIKVWTDKDIQPGDDWHQEIKKALETTKVAVLLVSTDFLDSKFITDDELPPLLDAARAEGVRILPVLVKPCAFGDVELVPLSRYQAVNMGRPLARLDKDTDREAEYQEILKAIRRHMEEGASDGAAPLKAASPAQAMVPPAASPAARRPPVQEVSPDKNIGESEEEETDEADGEEVDLASGLYAALVAMDDDPGLQELVVHTSGLDEEIAFMFVTEGRDGALLWEIAGNDELPSGLQFTRAQQRALAQDYGFNAPEVRGDRFWIEMGTDGDEADLEQLAESMAELIENVLALPSEDVGVDWSIETR